MSASENQAAETSKDADDMKANSPWNIIHIRLPPRKRLSDASLILSKKVPEPITDNLGKNLITAPVQGEASSHSPRAGLCNEASSNIMSKTLSAESESDTSGDKLLELDEANVSILSKNLRVAAEEQGSDASSYAAKQGLCEGANNNNPSMIIALPVQELPEDNNVSSPSKNHATTGKQGEVERINSPRKKLFCNTDSKLADEEGNSRKWNITITTEEVFEGANHPIPTKLSDEVENNAPSIRPSDPANKSSPHRRLTSSVQTTGTGQNTPGMNRSPSVRQAVEQSTNAPNMEVIKVYQEFEEKVKRNVYLDNLYQQATEAKTNPSMIIPPPVHELPEDHIHNSPSKNLATNGKQDKDEHNKSLRKKLLYGTDSKVEAEEGNHRSWKPIITAVKYEKMFEEANHPIPCKKLSVEAENKGPSNRPTDPANNKSVYKRQRTSSVQATGTSQNTPGMKLSASVSQAVEQSTNAANMDVKVYQDFEEKIKRTVYLDNLSHQATEDKTNPSRTLSTTAIGCEVFEHANHTIRTKKLSDVARNKAPSNRPTDPAKKSTPRKKPRTSAVQATVASQNTSTMRLPIPSDPAVKQSKCAADLEAIKQYQEFEEKVKRTVYLDNLSHQATESVIKAALSQFCTIRKVSFVVNYTIAYNIPQSALVEMETEKDAQVVVSMLHDFPFMMSGMPRPVRAVHATAEMFNDRPRRPGSKLKFRWVGHTDPDYKMLKKLKLLSRKHEVENLALIEHELEEEKLVAAKQQEHLNVNYEMMEAMDSVLGSGMSNYLSSIYNVHWNDLF